MLENLENPHRQAVYSDRGFADARRRSRGLSSNCRQFRWVECRRAGDKGTIFTVFKFPCSGREEDTWPPPLHPSSRRFTCPEAPYRADKLAGRGQLVQYLVGTRFRCPLEVCGVEAGA